MLNLVRKVLIGRAIHSKKEYPMRFTRIASLIASGALCAILSAQSAPKIEKTTITPTNAASGQQMFETYCAVCHGTDGRGGGPAAASLKVAPVNLTQLAAKNNGKFPTYHVSTALTSGGISAHGNNEMPIWGNLFKGLNENNPSVVRIRIVNLTNYIESLQAK